ncbi:MAG: phosphatase PAP2 family protein [Solirubrobacteraceae bacterium]
MPVAVRRLLAGAAATAFLTMLVYLLARRAGTAWWDDRILEILAGRLNNWRLQEAAGDLRTVFDVGPYIALVGLLVGSVLWRGRMALAGLLITMLLTANLSTWVLQHRLGVPRAVQVLDEPEWLTYWPSGHTTAAVAFAIAVWMASTPSWRPFVTAACVAGAALAAATNLIVRVHVPSDVLGGIGIAITWGLLALAAQRMWPAQLSPR